MPPPPITPEELTQILTDLRGQEELFKELLDYIGSDRLAYRLFDVACAITRTYQIVERLRAADPVLAGIVAAWESPPAPPTDDPAPVTPFRD